MLWLLRTREEWAPTVARLALAIAIFPHGAQKVFGWFGGYGISATIAAFSQQMGIPPFFTVLAILTEFLGTIALALGLFTRAAALAIAIEMVVAVSLVHAQYGFFMNWYGNKQGEGFEYHLLAVGLAVVLMIAGGGALSLDRRIALEMSRGDT
jgi:putative oxidoreductase